MKKTVIFLVILLMLSSICFADGNWLCPSCGKEDNTLKFCEECGTKKPDNGWICTACGTVNKGKFCEECGAAKESEAQCSYRLRDIVLFGSYPQTASGKDKTPIEWQVLDVQGDEALLISKYALDCKPYSYDHADDTWETCSLRRWLNDDFYNKAFSEEEKSRIIKSKVTADNNPNYTTSPGEDTTDNVFLLSISEVTKHLHSNQARMVSPTDYAVKNGANVSENIDIAGNSAGWWWLRSPGNSQSFFSMVNNHGDINYYGFYSGVYEGVRPCIRVQITLMESSTTIQPSSANASAPDTSTKSPDGLGLLILEAETVIRSKNTSASSAVVTTNRQENYKYESCDNGWYKLILDDSTYGYVYYPHITVILRAAGDNGNHGFSDTLRGNDSAGGDISGGNTGHNSPNAGERPTGGRLKEYLEKQYTPVGDPNVHIWETCLCVWDELEQDYSRQPIAYGSEDHTFENGVCTKCRYGEVWTGSEEEIIFYSMYNGSQHVVHHNGSESYEAHSMSLGRCSKCGYEPNIELPSYKWGYDTKYEKKDDSTHRKIDYHLEGSGGDLVIDATEVEAHLFKNGICTKCGFSK